MPTSSRLELSDLIRLKMPSYTDDAFIEHLALHGFHCPAFCLCARFRPRLRTAMAAPPPPPPPPPPAGDSVTVPLTGFSSFSKRHTLGR